MTEEAVVSVQRGGLIMPTLFIAVLSFQVPPVVLSFFLVDIAASFETTRARVGGVIFQLTTIDPTQRQHVAKL